MNKILTLGLLIILISCDQKSQEKKIDLPNKVKESDTKIENEDSTDNEPVKHETFNETVESLPENVKEFIPEGYSVIKISEGDLNLDEFPDAILVLRKNSEETTSNYSDGKPDKRPLLILLGQNSNVFKVAFRNDNAVNCIDCGGLFGDPFTGITIKKGYFSIESGIDGGQHWEQVTTFKFDKLKENWFLYKDHLISYKLNNDESDDAEALIVDRDKLETEKDFGVVPFDKFNVYTDN